MGAVQPPAPWPPGYGYYIPRRDANGLCAAAMWVGLGAVTTLAVGGVLLVATDATNSESGIALLVVLWVLGILTSIAAVILGGIGLGRAGRQLATNRGAAITGLVCGIVGTAVAAVTLPLLPFLLALAVMGP